MNCIVFKGKWFFKISIIDRQSTACEWVITVPQSSPAFTFVLYLGFSYLKRTKAFFCSVEVMRTSKR